MRDSTWDAKAKHLQNLCIRMQFSGYGQKFRYEVIDSAVKALQKIEDAVARGETHVSTKGMEMARTGSKETRLEDNMVQKRRIPVSGLHPSYTRVDPEVQV